MDGFEPGTNAFATCLQAGEPGAPGSEFLPATAVLGLPAYWGPGWGRIGH